MTTDRGLSVAMKTLLHEAIAKVIRPGKMWEVPPELELKESGVEEERIGKDWCTLKLSSYNNLS